MFFKPARTPLVFLVILVAVGAALWTACQGFMKRESDRKTNFLIILTDDLGYGDLGCFGNQTIKTPNLDRLASQGMRLTSCYAAAPVCSPSRVGLLTGRTPSRVGVYDWIPGGHPMHLPRNEITVARPESCRERIAIPRTRGSPSNSSWSACFSPSQISSMPALRACATRRLCQGASCWVLPTRPCQHPGRKAVDQIWRYRTFR